MAQTSLPDVRLPVAEPSASRTNRLEALTGLRFLAAMAVYAFHAGVPAGSPAVLVAFTASGYMGVTLFFALSGFVLALNYFDRLLHPTTPTLWNYAIARVARVGPLYVLALLFVIVIHLVRGASIADWPEHALALQAWDGSLERSWALNGVAWSVSVEVFLYASLPVLVLLLARVRSARALLAAAGVVIAAMTVLTVWFVASGRAALPWTDPGSAHRWLYRMPLTRLGDFTLGVLAARLYVAVRDRAGTARAGAPIALAAAAAIVILMAWPGHAGTAGSWDLDYAVPSAFLIFGLAAAPSGRLARLLSLPAAVLLGEASYAVFMLHRRMLNAFDVVPAGTPPSVPGAVLALMIAGLTICAAVGVHLLFERPARRFVRRFGERLGAVSLRTKRAA